MKYRNKRTVIAVILLVAAVFSVGFGIGFLNTEDGFDVVEQTVADKTDAEKISTEKPQKTEKISYYLVEEKGGSIKLYYVEGNDMTEIKSERISLDVLPSADVSLLSEGIRTQTADEALAVWENFTS